jgi:hypothetical protein
MLSRRTSKVALPHEREVVRPHVSLRDVLRGDVVGTKPTAQRLGQGFELEPCAM